jgi:hypothetical protein
MPRLMKYSMKHIEADDSEIIFVKLESKSRWRRAKARESARQHRPVLR